MNEIAPAIRAVSPALDRRSLELRQMVIRALAGGKRGHIGSSMSLIEIFRVLYDDILAYRPAEPRWPDRDRCILSKGHGCLALYVLLADKGFFPADELDRFCLRDSILGGHPEAGKVPGIEASTGALGHGLSIGVGIAIGLRMRAARSRVFVVVGDGEINEGSVWEAALSAHKHRLSNLTVMVDYNKIQSAGPVAEKFSTLSRWPISGGHSVSVSRRSTATMWRNCGAYCGAYHLLLTGRLPSSATP